MPSVRDERAAPRWQPAFGVFFEGTVARVRVWAPDATRVELEREEERNRVSSSPEGTTENEARFRSSLTREPGGFFSARVEGLAAGDRYRLVLDGGPAIPDPASRYQPDGVHGPSAVVDPSQFVWQHASPRRLRLDDLVVYELHIGTFTPEGTFAAAADKLAWLADLGVTAVELLPVAAFPGAHNWGYDGAALFAPAAAYGAPDDLARLVDRAHGLGLAVLLDVVYNHFGPAGAYAAAASSRFFSDRHTSPWGRGINLDGPDAEHVRRFFIDNALHWVSDYRFDGLRLDATHALLDDSDVHFLAALSDAVHESVNDRDVILVAEDHRNLRTLVEPRRTGGWGLDAIWADDFHHVVRRLVAGDDEGYFRDYRGDIDELVRTIQTGWLYEGQPSLHHGAPRGSSAAGLEPARAIVCLQNHDQVGNRALGDRLHHAIDLATWRALSVLLLVAPETPLLFMGQEWAASSPFQYFTDHEPELGRLVSEGRREEFGPFRAFADPELRVAIPDPQDPTTFERSKLRWDEVDRPPHAGTLALYRRLLRLRHQLVAEGPAGTIGPDRVSAADAGALWLRRQTTDGHELTIVVRLKGVGRVSPTFDGGAGTGWVPVLDTEDSAYATDPQPTTIADGVVAFARPGAVILSRK